MPKGYATLIDEIAVELQDTTHTIWSDTAELPFVLADAVRELSTYVPFMVKETLATTADSKELDISGIENLLWIEKLEYPIDQTPRQFRNWAEYATGVISMLISSNPIADEDVYLYCAKSHNVPSILDLKGEVDLPGSGYAAGVSTIHIDGFSATGRLEADFRFTIENDSTGTFYRLTQDSELSNGECDITFTPPLAEAIVDNEDVTFEPNSSLTPELERLVVELAAARASTSKAVEYINKIPKGGANVWSGYLSWGERKLGLVLSELRSLQKPKTKRVYLK